jgi:hypothetical protein
LNIVVVGVRINFDYIAVLFSLIIGWNEIIVEEVLLLSELLL